MNQEKHLKHLDRHNEKKEEYASRIHDLVWEMREDNITVGECVGILEVEKHLLLREVEKYLALREAGGIGFLAALLGDDCDEH